MNPITAFELAQRLGVGERTVQRRCRDREFPHMRIGRSIRFNARQVEEIDSIVNRERVQRRPEVDVPNPVYHPYATVVPIRRDPDAA